VPYRCSVIRISFESDLSRKPGGDFQDARPTLRLTAPHRQWPGYDSSDRQAGRPALDDRPAASVPCARVHQRRETLRARAVLQYATLLTILPIKRIVSNCSAKL